MYSLSSYDPFGSQHFVQFDSIDLARSHTKNITDDQHTDIALIVGSGKCSLADALIEPQDFSQYQAIYMINLRPPAIDEALIRWPIALHVRKWSDVANNYINAVVGYHYRSNAERTMRQEQADGASVVMYLR